MLLLKRNLSAQDLAPLIESLIGALPEDQSSTVISVKTENMPPTAANGQKMVPNDPEYDPGIVYVLEFCTTLALRDEETVAELGKKVVETLQAILRDASRHHAITVARAAFYVLRLLSLSYVSVVLTSAKLTIV
jgi:golgi-specific brefeldin A-resistance guanine nucleotide exchange factor 1